MLADTVRNLPPEIHCDTSIRARIIAPLAMGAAAILGILLFYLRSYSNYNLYGDDPAIFAASAGSPIDWFVHGFSNYFLVYPEWTIPFTNFLRPGVNGILRLDQIFFGTHYIYYFLLYYVAQFLMLWVVLLLAREMGVRERWLLLLALLLAIEPAFIYTGLVHLTYQFDVWCGLFAVAAFFFLSRERYALALISLTLAVFTKEAALYTPIAAAFTVAYGTRRKLLAGAMLLPLGAWFAVRTFVFAHSGANGIYAMSSWSLTNVLVSTIKGMLYWPSGFLKDENTQLIFFALNDLFHSPITPLFMSINLFLWVLLLVVGVMLMRRDKAALLSPFTVYIWMCGALSFGVLVGHESRLGGSIYPLELLLLAVAGAVLPISRWRTASLAGLCLMAPVFLWNMHIFSSTMKIERAKREMTLHLVDALKNYGGHADVIYILNSETSFSGPEYLAQLAGVAGHIVVLNQFHGCTTGNPGNIALSQTSASEMKIWLQLPPCAELDFKSVDPVTLDPAVGGTILRGDFASYTFPEARAIGRSIWVNQKLLHSHLGRQLNITLEGFDPHRSVFLYYDWMAAQYRCAGEQCATP